MKIHAKMIDSMSVSATPSSLLKYRLFIENLSKKALSKSSNREINFIGRNFRTLYDREVKLGISIKLTDDLITIVFMRRWSDSRKLIRIILHQPEAWKNPYQKLKKIEKDLKFHLGELMFQVERIDISIHFSGWKIDEKFLKSIVKISKGISLYDDNKGNFETLGIGSLNRDSVFMRLYNKTKYLNSHTSKASPFHLYQVKPFWGQDIYNLEFSFGGGFLKKDFAIESVSEVFEAIPSLWKWATEKYVYVLSEDKCGVHENWKTLSLEISKTNGRYFKRVSRKKPDPSLEFRKDQFFKKAKSLAKAMQKDSSVDTVELLQNLIRKM